MAAIATKDTHARALRSHPRMMLESGLGTGEQLLAGTAGKPPLSVAECVIHIFFCPAGDWASDTLAARPVHEAISQV